MSAPITLQLDPETEARLRSLTARRHQSPDAILREALTQYLDQVEQPPAKNYPQRTPVGGIITPV
jgi:predicted transcriptional regulator